MSKIYFYLLCIYVFVIPQYDIEAVGTSLYLFDLMLYSFMLFSAFQIIHLVISEKYFNLISENKSIGLYIFMLFSGISYFWTESREPLDHVSQVIKIIIIITPILFLDFTEIQINTLIKVYIFGTILGSFQVVYNYYYVAEYMYGTKRSFITGIDSNESAILIVIGFGFVLYNYFKSKNSFYLLVLLPLILAVFYTGSRTGFIAIIISTLLALFFFKLLTFKFSSLLIILSLVGIIYVMPLLVPSDNLTRITGVGKDLSTGEMSGREEIWAQAFLLMPKKIISGYGMSSFTDILESNFRRVNAHNVFVKAQFELGMIGLGILLVWLYFSFIKILKSKNEFKPLVLNSFIIIVVSFLQLSWIYSISLLVLIALVLNIASMSETKDPEFIEENSEV